MFPNLYDREPKPAQLPGSPAVSSPVRFDLLDPPLSIVFGWPKASWAPVPKAAIYKNYKSQFLQDEVRCARQRRDISPKSELLTSQNRPNPALETRTLRSYAAHMR